ncbi:hypothetical protein RAM19_05910 [Bartonella apihabitans]|nr:hypothetical protein [Bartonella apihabitans]WLT09665.1 hypothetical protein RAM19_05910 [Bartonella apihabitans]
MNLLQRLAIVLVLIIAAASGGFFMGQRAEKQKLLEAANAAFKNSSEVENEVEALTPYQHCLALGGLPYDCRVLMRGLDKTTQGK